ncbi:ferredoxin [Prauserella flavalba]|uniref:Ferredoxin n=1 Tax=Prauserella flavalba TaxID=1477506 RepID=A0A318LPR7_9PSEU|nr:ferredoxin [Prauserella flavalba]PXY35344.1 ferredoxin [Prauserella flavalba]
MKVTVDQGRCCGAGLCAMTAPAVFDQDDAEGTVLLLDPTPPAELAGAVREAAELCPNEVITVGATDGAA